MGFGTHHEDSGVLSGSIAHKKALETGEVAEESEQHRPSDSRPVFHETHVLATEGRLSF